MRNTSKTLSNCRRAAMAMLASGILAVPTAYAKSNIILVSPTDLPELARQPGDAMFLHNDDYGNTVLYVEQNHGAQLAVFDVTDPGHIKGKGSVQLGSSGPFEFVSPLGGQKELIRFRKDQSEAVLDFHKSGLPRLEQLPGLDSQGAISLLNNDGFIVSDTAAARPKAVDPQPIHDYQVFDTSSSRDRTHVFDVKQVREELTKQDTGTTFLLAEGGLYLIRRPIAESDNRRRKEDWFLEHAGG